MGLFAAHSVQLLPQGWEMEPGMDAVTQGLGRVLRDCKSHQRGFEQLLLSSASCPARFGSLGTGEASAGQRGGEGSTGKALPEPPAPLARGFAPFQAPGVIPPTHLCENSSGSFEANVHFPFCFTPAQQ